MQPSRSLVCPLPFGPQRPPGQRWRIGAATVRHGELFLFKGDVTAWKTKMSLFLSVLHTHLHEKICPSTCRQSGFVVYTPADSIISNWEKMIWGKIFGGGCSWASGSERLRLCGECESVGECQCGAEALLFVMESSSGLNHFTLQI